jgi:uncharacterized membrane protein
MTAGDRRDDREAEGSAGYERVVAFSDGVFAIAITLLVLGLDVPSIPASRAGAELPAALADLLPQVFSYFVGFAVIGLFWRGHHRFFQTLRSFDSTLLMINLAFLAFIALMPFTTGLFGRYGDVPIALVAYAASVAGASLLDTLMLAVALRRGLLAPEAARLGRSELVDSLVPAAVFLVSIPVAFVEPGLAPYTWGLLLVRGVLVQARARDRTPIS